MTTEQAIHLKPGDKLQHKNGGLLTFTKWYQSREFPHFTFFECEEYPGSQIAISHVALYKPEKLK